MPHDHRKFAYFYTAVFALLVNGMTTHGQHLYWVTTGTPATLERSKLDGSAHEVLLSQTMNTPSSITVDPARGKIYWADPLMNVISCVGLDGQGFEFLVDTGDESPIGVALDLPSGKIYWSTYPYQVYRADVDGTDVELVLQWPFGSFGWSHGIKIDSVGQKLYIADYLGRRIARTNLDGTDLEVLITNVEALSMAIDETAGHIYWADATHDTISRMNLDGSLKTDLVSTSPDSPSQMTLDLTHGTMFWTQGSTVKRASLSGTNVQTIPSLEEYNIRSLAFDRVSGHLYFTTGEKQIYRANPNGTGVVEIFSTPLVDPLAFTFDTTSETVYWSDYGFKKIRRWSLHGRAPTSLASVGQYGFSRGIAVVPDLSRVFWMAASIIYFTDTNGLVVDEFSQRFAHGYGLSFDSQDGKLYWTTKTAVGRINPDGTDFEPLVVDQENATSVAHDPDFDKIYWTDYTTGEIQRANHDGTGVESVVSDPEAGPASIVLDEKAGKMYWCDRNADTILRANLDGSNIEVVRAVAAVRAIALDTRTLPGDCTRDGVLSLADYAWFAQCLTGPILPYSSGCGCDDIFDDGSIDLADFAALQTGLSSP